MPVKIHGMPPSANAIGPCILAAHAECGGLEMCYTTAPPTTARPPHHCPTTVPTALPLTLALTLA